ncbi:ABC transporter transmembrane domain-containing protein [Amycolatopsis benzoatilytica]|uniref:ABC transporter transmembrane domain-containing protein n=1 Tax=Amycolatopsis benzoatilytica TaxID=346045 RepID=UPI00038040A2|nr:ABC transporter ATP-binding protein [Amycolatopsis benzoatilytica]
MPEPDTRGPGGYLWWLVRRQPARVLCGGLVSAAWMGCLMLPPYFLSRAVDEGLRGGSMAALLGWAAAILGVGAINAALETVRHRTMTQVRMDASFRTVRALTRQAVDVGATLPRKVSAGEVVSISATDVMRISWALTVTGPGLGGVVAFAVVAVLLFSVSPTLALVVLLGVPLLVVLTGPLLRRLQHVETEYRRQEAALTTRAADIAGGLRVLCGIGGKDRFAGGYRRASQALRTEGNRIGAVISWIQALGVGLPALFLGAVTWIAARMAAAGEITVGELVAVYGYVAVLVVPVSSFIEGAGDLSLGLVAARRVVRILLLRPQVTDRPDARSGPPGPASMADRASGLEVRAGELLVLATSATAEAVTVLERLARLTDADVRWGDVPLGAVALAEVRRRVVLSDVDGYLFAGPLRETLATSRDDDAITAALRIAAAEDVAAALPDGLSSTVDAKGWSLSGGQRQRLRLARAVLADADVLLLVDPAAAVDAHTESLIAERLRAARRGRSTVVVSTSPLLLTKADRVAFLADGRVVAAGSHSDLVGRVPAYRALVARGGMG